MAGVVVSTGNGVGGLGTRGVPQQLVSVTHSEKQGHAVLGICAGFGMSHQPKAEATGNKSSLMAPSVVETDVQAAPHASDHLEDRTGPVVHTHSETRPRHSLCHNDLSHPIDNRVQREKARGVGAILLRPCGIL